MIFQFDITISEVNDVLVKFCLRVAGLTVSLQGPQLEIFWFNRQNANALSLFIICVSFFCCFTIKQ